jgi:DNA uptake protein ComE-like DNA-binding protein
MSAAGLRVVRPRRSKPRRIADEAPMKNTLLHLALAILALTAPALPAKAQDAKETKETKVTKDTKDKGAIPWQNDAKKATKTTKEAREAKAAAAEARIKAKAKAKADARANALDINRATKEELVKTLGLKEDTADAIIAKRPYKTKADLVTKGALPMKVYLGLREQLAVK